MKSPTYVNGTIDTVIRLSEVEAFEKASKTAVVRHKVRVMAIYNVASVAPGTPPKDTVGTRDVIAKWSHGNKGFRELMIGLQMLASDSVGEASRYFEKTRLDERIIEIKDPGKRLRLFAFIDDNQVIVIAQHYQKHGKSTAAERKQQDKAIRQAIYRKELYLKAQMHEPDVYVIRK